MTKLHNFVVKFGLFAAPAGVLLQGSGCSKQPDLDDENESDELAKSIDDSGNHNGADAGDSKIADSDSISTDDHAAQEDDAEGEAQVKMDPYQALQTWLDACTSMQGNVSNLKDAEGSIANDDRPQAVNALKEKINDLQNLYYKMLKQLEEEGAAAPSCSTEGAPCFTTDTQGNQNDDGVCIDIGDGLQCYSCNPGINDKHLQGYRYMYGSDGHASCIACEEKEVDGITVGGITVVFGNGGPTCGKVCSTWVDGLCVQPF